MFVLLSLSSPRLRKISWVILSLIPTSLLRVIFPTYSGTLEEMGAASTAKNTLEKSSFLNPLVTVASGSKYSGGEKSALTIGLFSSSSLTPPMFPPPSFADDLPGHLSQSVIQVISDPTYLFCHEQWCPKLHLSLIH